LSVERLDDRSLPSSLAPVGPAGAALVSALGIGGDSHAHTVPHKEHCQGTLTRVVPGTLYFAGEGEATHFGKYTITGSNDFDAAGHVLDGKFTTIAADGSTISGVYAGTYTVLGPDQVRFDVHVLWLEGTGRLAGVTGEADTVAFLNGVATGSHFEYVTNGTLTFP
jgi:hypothetical protein